MGVIMIYNKEYYKSSEHFTCDTTPKRTVKHFELEIYDYGTGYASINNVLYPHSENMVIFGKPGEERFSIGSFGCFALHFSCGDDEICKLLADLPDCLFVENDVKKELISHFEKTSTDENLQTLASISNMLNIINNSNKINPFNKKKIPKKMIEIKKYIDNNYQSNIELEKLQKIADLSMNYIRKKFCEFYGITIQKYIIELRLSYVKKLLVSTDMSMCDIAYEAGFNSQSHMNYMFKSHFGISPLKYKSSNLFETDSRNFFIAKSRENMFL